MKVFTHIFISLFSATALLFGMPGVVSARCASQDAVKCVASGSEAGADRSCGECCTEMICCEPQEQQQAPAPALPGLGGDSSKLAPPPIALISHAPLYLLPPAQRSLRPRMEAQMSPQAHPLARSCLLLI